MKLPRDVPADHLIGVLEGLGYQVIRQKGSHVRLKHDGPPTHLITVPRHNPLKTGTPRASPSTTPVAGANCAESSLAGMSNRNPKLRPAKCTASPPTNQDKALPRFPTARSEEHTSELQSLRHL